MKTAAKITQPQIDAISQKMLIGLMAGPQLVIGDTFTEMVNAVETDIC